jgi:eukaryotic-like serine/threonine-protein kinase
MQPLEADDPRRIGPYRILRRLGVGGMGRVYLARSAGGRTVAVKVVHPHFSADEQFRERFRREVASARRAGTAPRRPGDAEGWTAPVLDADPDARTPWVATGYVAGPSLQQAVAEHGPLPEKSVRVLGAGLAQALRHVHGLGLVHRDVKPSNVMLTPGGPRLIDFGIARATDGTTSLTSTGVSMGSPGYMSPEQVLGSGASFPSDVFSLGAVLAYAARGEAPFPGESSAGLLYKVVHEEPELDGLSGELRELVVNCLAKDAAERPEPAQIAERLTGADIETEGWLPGPIVEQAGRRAVELLDLEPEEEASAPNRAESSPDSGPVPFTTPSHGPQQQSPPGTFGAANSPDFSASQDPPDPADPSSANRKPGRPGIAVTARAERSTRRVSCTLVLTAATALAIALLGSYFFHLLPGSGGGAGDSSAQRPDASRSADPSSPGATPSASSPEATPGDHERGDVPSGYLGTWKGQLTLESGAPGGTMRVTFEQGETGERVAYGSARVRGVSCEGDYTLDSADPEELTLTAVAPDGAPVCADGESVKFALRGDGTLDYSSRGEGPGEGEATLRKVE